MSKIIEDYCIFVEKSPDPKDLEYISESLRTDAEPQAGYSRNQQNLVLFVRSGENTVVGGLSADISWGWLYILKIWIQKRFRGKGIGSQLIKTAEDEAKKCGCRNAFLETFSFQARPLYEQLGYKIFGTLDDFPPGHKKYFMKKRLMPE